MELEDNKLKFNEKGLLPPGCHEVTLDIIKSVFVDNFPESETRLSRYNCFLKMYEELLDNVKSCIRILIDGSFVTNKLNPYDVDFVIMIDHLHLTQKESDYLNKIREYKHSLRIEYDNCRYEVEKGTISYSKLYNLEFYRYGCDFYILLRYDQSHEMYKNYLNQKKYWTDWWGKTRDEKSKGFLNLMVNYEEDSK